MSDAALQPIYELWGDVGKLWTKTGILRALFQESAQIESHEVAMQVGDGGMNLEF